MGSLIANELKTNMCLVSIKLFIVHTLSYEPLFPTSTTITTYSLYFFTLLFSILLAKQIFKPRLFCSHATSHKANRILTDCCLLCLAFVFAYDFSLMKILEVESLGFRSFRDFIIICVVLVA